MCLNETCIKLPTGKHLSDAFPTQNGMKEGHTSLSLLFNCAIRKFQQNQERTKSNAEHKLLVYADYVNILDENVNVMTKNKEASLEVIKQSDLQVYAENAKYMFMSHKQNAG